MSLNKKLFNQATLGIVLAVNLVVNIIIIKDAISSNNGWSTGILMSLFLFLIAPIGIILSVIILLLLKTKYIGENRKVISVVFVLFLYLMGFCSFFIRI